MQIYFDNESSDPYYRSFSVRMLPSILLSLSFVTFSSAINFSFENVQLTEADAAKWPAIRFAFQDPSQPEKECKYTIEDDEWPTSEEWARFNETLEGALLKPLPLATPCYLGPNYDEARCTTLRTQWARSTALQCVFSELVYK